MNPNYVDGTGKLVRSRPKKNSQALPGGQVWRLEAFIHNFSDGYSSSLIPMIIKAQHIHGPGKPVIKKEVHLAQRQAEQIISDARSQAERTIAEARHQQTAIMENARDQGYTAGL